MTSPPLPETPSDAGPEAGSWEFSQLPGLVSPSASPGSAEAPKLTDLCHRLIDTIDEFRPLRQFQFLVLWKAKGGTRAGEPKVTSTTLLGGLARYQAGAHFLITFAADHCSSLRMTDEAYESAMDHALCHCSRIVLDDGTEKAKIRHGIEVFPGELQRRGLWRADLQRVNDVIVQQPLWQPEYVVSEGVF